MTPSSFSLAAKRIRYSVDEDSRPLREFEKFGSQKLNGLTRGTQKMGTNDSDDEVLSPYHCRDPYEVRVPITNSTMRKHEGPFLINQEDKLHGGNRKQPVLSCKGAFPRLPRKFLCNSPSTNSLHLDMPLSERFSTGCRG
jgi:hypothetical protein